MTRRGACKMDEYKDRMIEVARMESEHEGMWRETDRKDYEDGGEYAGNTPPWHVDYFKNMRIYEDFLSFMTLGRGDR